MGTTLSNFNFDLNALPIATGDTLSSGSLNLGGSPIFNPYTGGAGTGATDTGTTAWGDKLTKALADLSKGANATNQAAGGGAATSGSMVGAQSGTGGGRAPSLDALVQLLMQRYQQLYPGGGSSKGLLGV